MFVALSDSNPVGESDSVIFTFVQQGPVAASLFLSNAGTNTLNYRFQEYINGVWTDMEMVGNPLNTSLQAGLSTPPLSLGPTTWPQVRLVANASGGSTILFTASQLFNRANGGSIPLLSY